MIYKTQEELDAAVKEWQSILRMQDWDITARFARRREIDGECDGHIKFSGIHHKALILLVDPIDILEDDLLPTDHSKILLHELIHIVTRPVSSSDDADLRSYNEETLINRIVRILFSLIPQYHV